MTTRVVHCKRSPHDVYIGRPTKWGNPFEMGKDGTRDEVVTKYRAWIVNQPELMASLHELKDKTIACWCSPQACHGDVLAELADKDSNEQLHVQVLPLHQNGKCDQAEEDQNDFDFDLDLHDYPVRICVAGSRTINDRVKFDAIIEAFLTWAGREPFVLVSGAARHGPDRLIIDWAKEHGIPCFEFPAEWDEFGKRAGMIRNGVMRKNITHLLAIWDGKSKGTLEMIESSRKNASIHVSVVTVAPDAQ